MKLKYILPVATIASVATAVTPLATSCSAGAIKLTKYVDVTTLGSGKHALKASKALDIKKDTKYTIEVKCADWKGKIEEWGKSDTIISFSICDDNLSPDSKTLEFEVNKITIDGKDAQYEWDDEWILSVVSQDINENSKAEFNITAKETKEKQNFYFQFQSD